MAHLYKVNIYHPVCFPFALLLFPSGLVPLCIISTAILRSAPRTFPNWKENKPAEHPPQRPPDSPSPGALCPKAGATRTVVTALALHSQQPSPNEGGLGKVSCCRVYCPSTYTHTRVCSLQTYAPSQGNRRDRTASGTRRSAPISRVKGLIGDAERQAACSVQAA